MFNNSNEDIGLGFRAIVAWGAAFLVVIGLGYAAWAWFYPAYLARQTEAIQNSPQFVLSGQEQIAEAIDHYGGLQVQIDQLSAQTGNEQLVEDMKNQQLSDICEARNAAELMQADTHPDRLTQRAKNFLAEHQNVVCN